MKAIVFIAVGAAMVVWVLLCEPSFLGALLLAAGLVILAVASERNAGF